MSEHVLEEATSKTDQAEPGRRHKHPIDETLILSELQPDAVLDAYAGDIEAPGLMTCGVVRETCPKCLHTHLQLILRQRQVRLAHLFCAQCHACFDAHYTSGVCALTI